MPLQVNPLTSEMSQEWNPPPSFFKVDNRDFYASFSYPELNTVDLEIRLLKIDAFGRDKHELLSNIKLRGHSKFCALSYVCGSPQNPVPILVNKHRFNAFANLAAAISDARDCWQTEFPDSELFLWTDQICINQNDDAERSQQVGIMREIYSNAHVTFVRLPASLNIGIDLPTWAQCRNWFIDRLEQLILTKFEGDGPSFNSRPQYQAVAFSPKFVRDTVIAWQELFAVAGSRWWRRAWIFQEFLVSPNVCFIWTPFVVPWSDLHMLWNRHIRRLGLLEDWILHARAQIESQEQTLRLHFEQKGLSDFCDIGCKHCDLEDSLVCTDPTICSVCGTASATNTTLSHIQQFNSIRHKFNRHYESFGTRIMLETKENPEHFPTQLTTFLRQSRYRDNSEARDRIYAYIGLMGSPCSMIPSYQKPLNAILTEAACEIVRDSSSLDVLSETMELGRTSSTNDRLPSWVPAWTAVDWLNPMRKSRMDPFWSGQVSTAKPLVRFLADGRGNENGVLCARGFKLDILVTRISRQELAVFGGTVRGVTFCTTPDAQTGDQIWALYGASKLYVFRPTGERVRLISEVYVGEGFSKIRALSNTLELAEIMVE